ncbi:MAG: 2-oxoglutarate/2-oxoacid ferredoxin oxidoreductase subunit alpha [Clostridiales bacterium]|nr:2-oxoglutarate/2-oxoacid ferredoxin oxidoreductase subunit alpha [Clostridiales bacterium]MDN5297560.1 2-oxoglutarate/2-oxoacid ferredoxin oxidoreductase subunit alpha [Clostridiales bacterium]
MKKTIVIAGAAGEGINTAAQFVERMVKEKGLYFLSYKNYMSRVRGGYNFTTLTVSDIPVHSICEEADFFLALNDEATQSARAHMAPNGMIATTEARTGEGIVSLKSEALAAIKNKNSGTMAGVGAIAAYLGFDKENLSHLEQAKWSEAINQQNAEAAALGYDLFKAVEHPAWQLKTPEKPQIMLNGNTAVALGAIAAGAGFYCAYPMAPSTGIMAYLMKKQKETHMLVEQAEDEIAAMMAAIGAASNGVRAMTGTSGGGFSLMVEALGFAAVSEVPLVACNVQRPGPATGLPTRTEQADLLFTLFASQGEFARIVLAPTSVSDAFYTTFRAFNLAEKYQVPVLILTDQYLADSTVTTDRFNTEALKIERYVQAAPIDDYKRYDFESYIGNRKYPGIDSQSVIMTDSHVHDVYGHVSEAKDVTIALKKKMMHKMTMILSDLNQPELVGVSDYTHLLIAWGSTAGVVREAVQLLNDNGQKTAALCFSDIYPMAENVLDDYMKPGITLVNVEGNATNQFGKLLRMETGVKYTHSINRYDGRPFTAKGIMQSMEVIINE